MNTEMNMNGATDSRVKEAQLNLPSWSARIQQVCQAKPLNAYQRSVIQVTFCPVKRSAENLL